MATTSTIVYLGDLRTQMRHERSGETVITDAPLDNNGKGEAFSPTDLVATGLGSCMLTMMGIKARDLGIDLGSVEVKVEKIMASDPRRISKIVVELRMPNSLDPNTCKILENTARTCPVAKSLHPDIDQEMIFFWP
ncbi:MAG: OsmC family protein [Bacteroidota bacterium]|nr:OsmC family protein [Bacteroidota bacterium]MDX5504659.1 OsmC family protein [Bacteroidota bacterium]